jgi:hypothetical protein
LTESQEWSSGEGRTRVALKSGYLGNDIVIFLYNDNAHIGAVAVAEYDDDSRRTSTSLITRRGHKDDVVAQRVAYLVAKSTKKPACVIAGIHVDDITETEINEIIGNVENLTNKLIKRELNDG